MPKLDLTRARQIKGPMGDIKALKGPGYAWSRAPLLSDFYGIGTGQIPMDLRLDDPAKLTLSGALIRAVSNDGGAGAAFDAAAGAGSEPSLPASGPTGADFSAATAGTRSLVLANPADLQGAHFLCPFTVPVGSSVGFVASGPGGFSIPAFRGSHPRRMQPIP